MTFVIFVYSGKKYTKPGISVKIFSVTKNRQICFHWTIFFFFFYQMDLYCGTNDGDCLRIYKLNKL